jgi:hypothetical protein
MRPPFYSGALAPRPSFIGCGKSCIDALVLKALGSSTGRQYGSLPPMPVQNMNDKPGTPIPDISHRHVDLSSSLSVHPNARRDEFFFTGVHLKGIVGAACAREVVWCI